MYKVQNLTSKTIILSDIRVEIKPFKILDLEQIADRPAIEKSRDLLQALNSRKLAVVKQTEIKSDVAIAPKQELDLEKFQNIVESAIQKHLSAKDNQAEKMEDVVKKAVHQNTNDLLSLIRNQINSVQPNNNDLTVDPEKLAEISQKPLEKMIGNIETGGSQKSKKTTFINKKIDELSDEL